MDLNVLYFAHVRSIVGKSQESLTVPCSATVGTAVAAVVERYPPLATLMASIRIAVNGEFVYLDHALTGKVYRPHTASEAWGWTFKDDR